LKAFAAVNDMIKKKDLFYDNRTSPSDDESVASYMKYQKAKEENDKKEGLADMDKKFFTSLPTCYSLFFTLIRKFFNKF
jgi:hypothetical protein